MIIDYRDDLSSRVSGAFDNIISFHEKMTNMKKHKQGFVSIDF